MKGMQFVSHTSANAYSLKLGVLGGAREQAEGKTQRTGRQRKQFLDSSGSEAAISSSLASTPSSAHSRILVRHTRSTAPVCVREQRGASRHDRMLGRRPRVLRWRNPRFQDRHVETGARGPLLRRAKGTQTPHDFLGPRVARRTPHRARDAGRATFDPSGHANRHDQDSTDRIRDRPCVYVTAKTFLSFIGTRSTSRLRSTATVSTCRVRSTVGRNARSSLATAGRRCFRSASGPPRPCSPPHPRPNRTSGVQRARRLLRYR